MAYKFNPFTGKFDIVVDEFKKLTDTPNSYSGQAFRYVNVKENETGLEFTDAPPSAISGPIISDYCEVPEFTTSSTDFVDVTDCTLTFIIPNGSTARIYSIFSYVIGTNKKNSEAEVRLQLLSPEQNSIALKTDIVEVTDEENGSVNFRTSILPAGTYTMKAQIRKTIGDDLVKVINGMIFGFVLLGPKGDTGVGVPVGGTVGQTLIKELDDDYATIWANHNDIAGLQGGIADEYYHITNAEYSVLQNTSGVNTGDQDLSGLVPYTGATSDVDLGEYDLTTTGTGTFGDLEANVYTDEINFEDYPALFLSNGNLTLDNDLEIDNSLKGVILKDTVTGIKYRISITNGSLVINAI